MKEINIKYICAECGQALELGKENPKISTGADDVMTISFRIVPCWNCGNLSGQLKTKIGKAINDTLEKFNKEDQ